MWQVLAIAVLLTEFLLMIVGGCQQIGMTAGAEGNRELLSFSYKATSHLIIHHPRLQSAQHTGAVVGTLKDDLNLTAKQMVGVTQQWDP